MSLRPFFLLLILFFSSSVFAQKETLKNDYWYVQINRDGSLDSLAWQKDAKWSPVPMQKKEHRGFSFYYVEQSQPDKQLPITLTQRGNYLFVGKVKDVELTLEYAVEGKKLKIIATAKNTGSTVFSPLTLGLKTGISNYMTGYPQWNEVYFPTMLHCEKTHFTGYLQTPGGQQLAVVSPNAIAAYSLDYNFGYGSGNSFFYGHRIYTFNLGLLNAKPLPLRHPQAQASLAPGEKRSWEVYLQNVPAMSEMAAAFHQLSQAPSFDIPATAFDKGESFRFKLFANKKTKLSVRQPNGEIEEIRLGASANGVHQLNYLPKGGVGVYTFEASGKNGKVTEAKVSVLKPYSWYLKKARLGALKYTQKASWNCENWYGFYSGYLAQQYFPNAVLNKQMDKRFNLVMSLMYDTAQHWKPTQNVHRIQNHSTTIGILVDKYLADKNIADLEAAKYLADWIIDHAQSADGAYRNGKVHYTSVIYIAKSIMELMAIEKTLAEGNNQWAQAYAKHYHSVKRAIDQLTGGFDAIDTEGEMTFEDGMISCSALQIAAFALLQTDAAKRKFYTDAAAKFLKAHACLEQSFVNDTRMRGGSLRFWEAQYDVLIGHNFMNSPHGWSAWTTYATYYMYLLTGEEQYLVQTMNGIGSGMQLIDFNTGDLRWAFCVDPYINTIQARNFTSANPDVYNNNQYSPYEGKYDSIVIGEQYVNMIADKFDANSSDNDVHEQFKCMAEVVLTSAYVLERKDGSLLYYNCVANKRGNTIIVVPNENIISKVNLNLQNTTKAKVEWGNGKSQIYTTQKGLQWVARR